MPGYIADHATERSKFRWKLVEILLGTPIRVTDCPIAIEYGGHTWLAGRLTMGQIQNRLQGATADFSLADADGTIFPALDAVGGGEGVVVNIWTAEFIVGNITTAVPSDAVQAFTGRILTTTKDTTSGTDKVDVSVGPVALTTAMSIPTRLISDVFRHA